MGKSKTVILERCFVPKNALVMRKDDAANCAYLIQSGSVGVYGGKGDEQVELARLGVGDIFGEMALVHDNVRTADVRALEDCNLIMITRQTFMEKLAKSDPTIKAIVEMLVDRVMHLNASVTNNIETARDLKAFAEEAADNVLSRIADPEERLKYKKQVQPRFNDFIKALSGFLK